MANTIQHEDFGEKIGGAKKDLWKDRGLYADDLSSMNEREAEKFVKKDNVWKKPDYQAMLDAGSPLGVVYFVKKVRDSLGASPQYRYSDNTPEKRFARQKEYIDTVRQIQAVMEDVQTVADAMGVYDRFLVGNGYVDMVQGWGSGIHYSATEKGRNNPVITDKLARTLHIRSEAYFERDFTQKARKEQFGVPKDQKVPAGYAIHFYDGENELTSKTFKYQADISGADFTPQPPTGKEDYVFQGWYDNESLEGTAYSFKGKTMPAGDFPLYAKWTEPVYEVSFDLNGADLAAQADPDAYDDQQVKKGEIVTRPADPVREGYTFAGWTRADSPFHFGTGITADTTLKARWISNSRFTLTYDPGAGVGDPETDSRLYADGAKASLWECPKGWQAPQEHYGFLCWNSRADGSGRSYYPSDSFTMPADDVTLYAQWALIRETTLTYVYNYEGAPDPTTVPLETPNALYAIEENNPERTGYRFLGWTIDQAGNGTLYQKGDKIRVDTLNEETNKLYAQWEIEIKPPTGLATETMPFVWMLVLAGMTVVLELTERKKDR